MAKRYSIVVMGCDEYSDIADLCALFLKRYWKKSGRKIYVTETLAPQNSVFDLEIVTTKGMIWSERLLVALEQIETPYVILLCDDFFLSQPVREERLDKLINICIRYQLGCLKLMPAADKYEAINAQFGNCKEGIYRLSTMPAIWDKDYLKCIASIRVNAWDFELKGSKYSMSLQPQVWCTRKKEIQFVHSVNKGRWEYQACYLFRREHIPKKYYRQRKNQLPLKYFCRTIGGVVYRIWPNFYQKIKLVILHVVRTAGSSG